MCRSSYRSIQCIKGAENHAAMADVGLLDDVRDTATERGKKARPGKSHCSFSPIKPKIGAFESPRKALSRVRCTIFIFLLVAILEDEI